MYFDAAVEHGIDEVLALLEEPEREFVLDSLTLWALAPPDEKPCRVFGGIYKYEYDPDPEKAARMKREIQEGYDAEDRYFMEVTRPRIDTWWKRRNNLD